MTWRIPGSNLFWMDWEKRRLGGFAIANGPKVGDKLECVMKSGKTAVFEFTKVDWMMDPKDQFFATVKDVKYL